MPDDAEFDRARAEYEAAPVDHTTIRARRGKLVHATDFNRPNRTLCGRTYDGWIVAPECLTCAKCRRAVGLER